MKHEMLKAQRGLPIKFYFYISLKKDYPANRSSSRDAMLFIFALNIVYIQQNIQVLLHYIFESSSLIRYRRININEALKDKKKTENVRERNVCTYMCTKKICIIV